MTKNKKMIMSIILVSVVATGMYSAYKTDGDVDFTNNKVAQVVTKGYQKSEDFAVKSWQGILNFFVK